MTASSLSPVAKTAIDAIQAKYSAVMAGYNPMVADRHDLYQQLLEKMMARIHQHQDTDETTPPSSTKRKRRHQQTPLVNAGYASRVLAMSHRIQSFLLYHQMTAAASFASGEKKKVQLLFLGCGLDVMGM